MKSVTESASGAQPDVSFVLCVGLTPTQIAGIREQLDSSADIHSAVDAAEALAALARRAKSQTSPAGSIPSIPRVGSAGHLHIDVTGRQALLDGHDLRLSAREFDLLHVLHREPGRAWSYKDLSVAVWRQEYLGDRDRIRSAVRRLRQRLARVPSVQIVAVPSIGFRMDIETPSYAGLEPDEL